MWLAQGNGVCRYCPGSKVQSYAEYYEDKANYKCNSSLRVRKWEDFDWHEPTADYMGLDSWVDKATSCKLMNKRDFNKAHGTDTL